MSKPSHNPDTDQREPHVTPRRDRPARVVVAGVGLVTPLGLGAWPTYRALLAGRTIADRAGGLADGLPATDLALALGGVSVARHTATDPAVELAERAAREAASNAGVDLRGLPLTLGTSKGAVARLSTQLGAGLPLDEVCQQVLAMGPHAYLAHKLANRLGTHSRSHHVAACASGLVALDAARRRLAHAPDTTDEPLALVVTADAALTPCFVHSYQRLGVLAEPTPAGYRQYPLDERRRGFMLAESGAAVLLKRLPIDQAPAPGEVELVKTATACEAGHLIHTSPEMPALDRVARQLFAAGSDRGVDVLHPHAPGTPDHDPQELAVLHGAIRDTAGPDAVQELRHYACKGALGHGLGSAGLTAFVIAVLAMRTQKLPPMPWLQQPILPHLHPTTYTLQLATTHAVFAAGFGGHTAGALLRVAPSGPPAD